MNNFLRIRDMCEVNGRIERKNTYGSIEIGHWMSIWAFFLHITTAGDGASGRAHKKEYNRTTRDRDRALPLVGELSADSVLPKLLFAKMNIGICIHRGRREIHLNWKSLYFSYFLDIFAAHSARFSLIKPRLEISIHSIPNSFLCIFLESAFQCDRFNRFYGPSAVPSLKAKT